MPEHNYENITNSSQNNKNNLKNTTSMKQTLMNIWKRNKIKITKKQICYFAFKAKTNVAISNILETIQTTVIP